MLLHMDMKGILVAILGAAVVGLGVYVMWKLNKYEFHNTTDGGVVEFESYWKMQVHAAKQVLAFFFFVLGTALIIWGGVICST